jgi:hypothetical protein
MQLSARKSFLLFMIALTLLFIIYPPVLAQEEEQEKTETHQAKIYQVPVSPTTSTINTQTDNPPPAPPNSSTTGSRTNLPTYDMTTGEKLSYGAKKAFFSPSPYAFSAFSAYFQIRDEDKPNKDTGDKFADGLSRFARNYGRSATKNLLAYGVYPAIFRQDPRYEPSPKSGFKNRTLHAMSRVFITRGDNGSTQVNTSLLGGTVTASALANIWERSSPNNDRKGIGPTFERIRGMIIVDIIRNVVFKEFGPDIKRLILRR